MPPLDLATIHICSILLSSAFGVMFLIRWRRDGERHLLLAGESAILYAVVLAGLGALAWSPVATGLLVGLLSLSTTILIAAVRAFDGEREIDVWVFAPPVVSALAYLLPSLFVEGPAANTAVRVLNSVLLAGTMVIAVVVILRRPTAAPSSTKIVAVALLGYLPCYALSIALEFGLGTAHDWLATVPMLADQALLGVLNVGLLAMSGERDAARLREQALRDPLTGAWNRAGLAKLATRFDERGAAIAIDIDHFKRINDRDGHAAGDAVLTKLAGALVAASPRGGEVVRLGGDEFALLLPDAALAEGAASAILASGGDWTVSLGIGRIVAGDAGLAPALARADTMLYRAKAAGRAQLAA